MAGNGQKGTRGLPRHVGLIMDGNGRWAKRRGLPRNMGHRAGAEAFKAIVRHADKLGIEYLTAFAFSTENWSRPKDEIDGIMDLLRSFLRNADNFRGHNNRLNILGDPSPLAPDLRERIGEIHRESEKNTGMTVNIALNYGGRGEIVHAARVLLRRYSHGEIRDIGSIGEADFEACLYTAGQPDVDLVIRTSGEQRVSNFLLWQAAYAEYVFPEVYWPDFTPARFDKALREYAARDRRMGRI